MIAQVILNSNAKDLDRTFDYEIPEEMQDKIKIGNRVIVPFGRRVEEGFIVGFVDESEFKTKPIISFEENEFINEEKIEMAKWIAKRYFANLSDSLKLMLPPGTTSKNFDNRVKEKTEKFVYLVKTKDEIEELILSKKIKSEKHIRALRFLFSNNGIMVSELETLTDISKSIIKTLERNGYLEIKEEQIDRNPFANRAVKRTKKLTLTEEQDIAFNKIKMNEYKEYLLLGVTGSGKTEIYMQLIEENLKNNKSSIMLVPEISLTPQMVDNFMARFGEERIALLHSKLSVGERFDTWNRIVRGDAKIIIGARSAIFAPAKEIGLIIIDEEHDSSYQSEMTPKYNAKEVARYIANKNNCPLVLGSATPDMLSYKKALEGKIELLELTKRANNASLPEVEIVDLRDELAHGNHSMISRKLKEEIEKNLENKEQTLLFLNRRGYSTFIMCRDCGYTVKCKNCNITMTYHLKQDKLKCHYCGYETKRVTICPECSSTNIRYFGTGTQKLEQEINKLFPSASTIRMDIDTVTKKNSHEEILNKFKNENIDILIGTQMIVKGHHFSNVSLVGVIAADSSLNIEDFRANERTFQLLTQVEGRAGREKKKGRVIVQTYNPDSVAIELAKEQNYKEFYESEVGIRKQLKYPPFCDIIMLSFSSSYEQDVINQSKKIYQYLKKRVIEENIGIILYSPVPSPIDKIKNKFRWRIIIKCLYEDNINKLLQDMLEENEIKKNVRISIEINPYNMM
ncbi:MAG: primosomal protein N' [Clostridia bacterium]|nr:primosomal protein N' [Clostridia bacterium]